MLNKCYNHAGSNLHIFTSLHNTQSWIIFNNISKNIFQYIPNGNAIALNQKTPLKIYISKIKITFLIKQWLKHAIVSIDFVGIFK